MRRWRPQAPIICVCTGPAAVASRFAVESLPVDARELDRRRGPGDRLGSRFRRVIHRVVDEAGFWTRRTRWLRDVDLFIVAGTGALDDMAVRPWNAPYDLFKWCQAARLAGARVLFLSVGAGPIVHPVSRMLMLRALRLADYRSYRDEASLDWARSVGIDVDADHVYPDLGFSLPGIDWRAVAPLSDPPRTVAVGVIGYYGWRHDQGRGEPVYRTYVDKMAEFTGWLLARGYEVRLIGGDLPTDRRPIDDVVRFVAASQPGALRALRAEPVSCLDDLCRELARADVLVATRFHNLLTGLLLGRPAVSIGYHVKNDALMADVGLGDYCQDIEGLEVARLIEQFHRLVGQAAGLASRIRRRADEYRARLEEQYRTVLSVPYDAETAISACARP